MGYYLKERELELEVEGNESLYKKDKKNKIKKKHSSTQLISPCQKKRCVEHRKRLHVNVRSLNFTFLIKIVKPVKYKPTSKNKNKTKRLKCKQIFCF